MPEKIPKKKKAHKGTLGDRCLKTLAENNDKVILALREGGEIVGQIRGVGQFAILVNEEGRMCWYSSTALNLSRKLSEDSRREIFILRV